MIPLFVKALYDIDKWENRDPDFNSPFLSQHVSPSQQWTKWINLKGVAMGSPVIDEADIRDQLGPYAVENNLFTNVQNFFFKIAQDNVCKPAIGQKSVLETAMICGITESIATGNPIYPLFDLRNIKKECKGWFTCQKGDSGNGFRMNHGEIVKLFRANRNRISVQNRGRWRWSDCNAWDGWTIKDELMKSEIGPNTTVHISHLLDLSKDKKLKVLIYNGEQDFQVNWKGLEKVITELDWYGKADFNEDTGGSGSYIPWTYKNY